MTSSLLYISITGPRLKRSWLTFRFQWHAARSFWRAKMAPRNLGAGVRTIKVVHRTPVVRKSCIAGRLPHTVSAYAASIRAFRSIGTGKTLGFEADTVPSWNDVHQPGPKRGRSV